MFYNQPITMEQQFLGSQSKAFSSLSFRGKRGYSNTFKTTRTHNLKQKIPIEDYPSNTYGGILRTRQGQTQKYALVQGRYTGKWSFPKGHANKDESPINCSTREISEETSIDSLPDPVNYIRVGHGHYYIFDLEDEVQLVPRDTNEIMNTRWATVEEMRQMSLNADASIYLRTFCHAFS